MKIWYQTCSSIGSDAKWSRYERSLRAHIGSVVRNESEVHIQGSRFYTPAIDRYHYLEYWNARSIIENAVEAEKKGYDVFALGCFLDTGFREIQEIVDIPVAFSCQVALHMASMLVNKFMVLVPNNGLKERVVQKVTEFGFDRKLVSCTIKEFAHEKLQEAIEDVQPIWDELMEVTRGHADAELIVPG